jgi:MraZ protein
LFFFGSKYCGDGKDLYEQSINGEDVDFADLAEDVMGNINDDDNGIS